MIPRHINAVLASALEAVAEAALDSALMGGYAVASWAVPRATFDIDLLVIDDDEKLAGVLDALEARGFDVPRAYRAGWRETVGDMPMLKVSRYEGGRAVPVELFPVATEFQESALSRSSLQQVAEGLPPCRIVSAADLVLFKLMADRHKDRADIQNLLVVQGIPDQEYLRRWADRLRVMERLERALREAGLST